MEESASQQPAASVAPTPQQFHHCCYASCFGLLWSHPTIGPALEATLERNHFTSDLDFSIDWAKASSYKPPSPESTSSQLDSTSSSAFAVPPPRSATDLDRPNTMKKEANKQLDFSHTAHRTDNQEQRSSAAHGDTNDDSSTSARSVPIIHSAKDQSPLVEHYKDIYNQASEATAELIFMHDCTRYFSSGITQQHAKLLFPLLWALGFLLSERVKKNFW